jgi:hypothetical protein
MQDNTRSFAPIFKSSGNARHFTQCTTVFTALRKPSRQRCVLLPSAAPHVSCHLSFLRLVELSSIGVWNRSVVVIAVLLVLFFFLYYCCSCCHHWSWLLLYVLMIIVSAPPICENAADFSIISKKKHALLKKLGCTELHAAFQVKWQLSFLRDDHFPFRALCSVPL